MTLPVTLTRVTPNVAGPVNSAGVSLVRSKRLLSTHPVAASRHCRQREDVSALRQALRHVHGNILASLVTDAGRTGP